MRAKNHEMITAVPSATVVMGEARFVGPHEVVVATADGPRRIVAETIVVNTGSTPALPPIPGARWSGRVHDSTSIQRLEELPGSVAVVGAGPIGIEFASILGRFGSRVTLLNRGQRLLPAEDADVAEAVAGLLRRGRLQIGHLRFRRRCRGRRRNLLGADLEDRGDVATGELVQLPCDLHGLVNDPIGVARSLCRPGRAGHRCGPLDRGAGLQERVDADLGLDRPPGRALAVGLRGPGVQLRERHGDQVIQPSPGLDMIGQIAVVLGGLRQERLDLGAPLERLEQLHAALVAGAITVKDDADGSAFEEVQHRVRERSGSAGVGRGDGVERLGSVDVLSPSTIHTGSSSASASTSSGARYHVGSNPAGFLETFPSGPK